MHVFLANSKSIVSKLYKIEHIRLHGSSAVTCTIISFCVRSRGRRTSLESKPIASGVCRCSFFISSKLNSLKVDETAAPMLTLLTSLQSIHLAREPENSVKVARKAITLSLFLSLPNFQEHRKVHWKKSRYFLLVFKSHFRLVTMSRKFTYTKVIYVLFFFRWRSGPRSLF